MQGLYVFGVGCIISLALVTAAIILSEKVGKGHVPVMIAGVLAGVTILADVLASGKLAELTFFGQVVTIDGGTCIFPVILLGQDYLNEFYGPKAASTAVWGGFLSKIFFALMLPFVLSDFFPAAEFAVEIQDASRIALNLGPRIAIVSIIAYFLSGYTNVLVYDWVNKKTKGGLKWLWLRNNLSSNVAMLFDNILFCFGAFYGEIPTAAVWSMVFAGILLKWICNWLDTIFLYLMYWLKKTGVIYGKETANTFEEEIAAAAAKLNN